MLSYAPEQLTSTRPRRILLPVDFSPCSEAALQFALQLGELFEADIDVLHVWAPAPSTPEADFHMLGLLASTERGVRLREWLGEMDADGRTRAVLEVGDPCSTILDVAASAPYDLIVMGTNGRSAVRQIISPSVAERVVRRAPCPVVTVRAARENRRPDVAAIERTKRTP